jgi:hypothetical protein
LLHRHSLLRRVVTASSGRECINRVSRTESEHVKGNDRGPLRRLPSNLLLRGHEAVRAGAGAALIIAPLSQVSIRPSWESHKTAQDRACEVSQVSQDAANVAEHNQDHARKAALVACRGAAYCADTALCLLTWQGLRCRRF